MVFYTRLLNLYNIKFKNSSHMCKKGILNKLKDMAKSVPGSAMNIKQNAVEKLKSIKTQESMKKITEKAKQQLMQKQKNMKQIAEKAKELAQNKKIGVKQSAAKILQSAAQVKDKIIDSETLKNSKQVVSEKAQKVKQGLQVGRNVATKKTIQVLKGASNILNKQKEVVQKYSQKLKQNIQKKPSQTPKLESKQQNISDSILNKIAEMGVSAPEPRNNQQKPLQQQQQINQLPPPLKQQKSGYNFSVANIGRRILQKSKKYHEQIFTNRIVKHTHNFFTKILSSLYWRLLFAICLVTFVYVSPKLIQSVNRVYVDFQKLELQRKQAQRKQLQLKNAAVKLNQDPSKSEPASLWGTKSF